VTKGELADFTDMDSHVIRAISVILQICGSDNGINFRNSLLSLPNELTSFFVIVFWGGVQVAFAQGKKHKNDVEHYKLKGKIKSFRETIYYTENDTGIKQEWTSTRIYTYNTK